MSINNYSKFPKIQGLVEIASAALIASVLVTIAIGITNPGALPVLAVNLLV